MEPYTIFSSVYDSILKHIDYEYWYKYICDLMFRYVDSPESILELGCGTGKFGAKFSRDNYSIFGIDKSIEMLKLAKLRSYLNFHILCADMLNFTFSQKFDFIFSVHDTMNYFIEYDDFRKVLKSVRGIMHKNSIFMFDLTTEFNIKKYFYNNRNEYFIKGNKIIWENNYDEVNKLIHSILTFHNNGSIKTEEHIQRIFSVNEIEDMICKEKLRIIDMFGDYTFMPVKYDSVMINFVTSI